ncbi:hypothetical protein HQN89_10700 [Paenibacillus frigoriresistens]|uniref:hypothetical protein n=1 Tax=Paenibacillus alginolyticus TaxID=59839 RepID=UPI0015678ED0|nr:hypothetical protein [Paenibacillus frigoriresistens]NRF91488.1 hypothetical protein [Paenibacillus frigoriresistens]
MKVFIEDIIVKGKVTGKMFIESDSMQYTITVYNGKVSDKGVEAYTNKGYYATLEQAVKQIMRMKISESTATTLSELIQDIKRIERWIESKINA